MAATRWQKARRRDGSPASADRGPPQGSGAEESSAEKHRWEGRKAGRLTAGRSRQSRAHEGPAGLSPLQARGKSPPDVFPGMKTSGFHGSCAPAIASLRLSRLFVHSLLAARGKSPPDVFPRMKISDFHGSYAPAIASLRSSRLFVHSLLGGQPPVFAGAPLPGPRPCDPTDCVSAVRRPATEKTPRRVQSIKTARFHRRRGIDRARPPAEFSLSIPLFRQARPHCPQVAEAALPVAACGPGATPRGGRGGMHPFSQSAAAGAG